MISHGIDQQGVSTYTADSMAELPSYANPGDRGVVRGIRVGYFIFGGGSWQALTRRGGTAFGTPTFGELMTGDYGWHLPQDIHGAWSFATPAAPGIKVNQGGLGRVVLVDIYGDGIQTTWPIPHNLNTLYVVWQITNNGMIGVVVEVQLADENNLNVLFDFPPEAGSHYRIAIIG